MLSCPFCNTFILLALITRRQIVLAAGAGSALAGAGYLFFAPADPGAGLTAHTVRILTPELQRQILDRYNARLKSHPEPGDDLLLQWITEDFQQERTCTVQGWLLAETEIAHSIQSAAAL